MLISWSLITCALHCCEPMFSTFRVEVIEFLMLFRVEAWDPIATVPRGYFFCSLLCWKISSQD